MRTYYSSSRYIISYTVKLQNQDECDGLGIGLWTPNLEVQTPLFLSKTH